MRPLQGLRRGLQRRLSVALLPALAAGLVAICPPATAAAPAAPAAVPVEISYLMWDAGQVPVYRQCAADFSRQRPDIRIKFRQMGWGDYWTSLAIGFIAGLAPDVFVNHLSHYPHFAENGLLLDLAPLIRRDGVDTGRFVPGLNLPWQRDGHQYGLPKDWDTVALIVNLDRAAQAGVTLAELQAMHWNPRDGGSFEQVARRLSLDAQGRNATDPAFDRRRVRMHGYQNPGPGGMSGQTEWSHFAVSNGFRFQDKPWAPRFHYDDPRLAETLDWLAGLPAKGVSAGYETSKGLGADALFASGRVAMIAQGSWMINYFAGNTKFRSAWVPLPQGPVGRRASMLNGLADSVWSGSKHPEQAWAWVRYLGSPACQSVVAARGVVFPAVDGLAERVLAAHRVQGVDSSAFLQMAREQTFSSPVTAQGAEIEGLMNNAIESVLLGRSAAGPALKAANQQVNQLLRPAQRR